MLGLKTYEKRNKETRRLPYKCMIIKSTYYCLAPTGIYRSEQNITSDETRRRRLNWIGQRIALRYSIGVEARKEEKTRSTQNNMEEDD